MLTYDASCCDKELYFMDNKIKLVDMVPAIINKQLTQMQEDHASIKR